MRSLLFSNLSLLLTLASGAKAALVKGVDTGGATSEATWSEAKGRGFDVGIVKGIFEACGEGGAVEPSFLGNVRSMQAAGYKNIEAYIFPCTGLTYNCKSPAEQVALLRQAIDQNHLPISRVWLDIEPGSSECPNEWDRGVQGNVQFVKDLAKAVKAAGFETGIYSGLGSWEGVFKSADVVVDTSLPLWFANYNDRKDLALTLPFGGWKSAVGHQYGDSKDLDSPSHAYDVNVFDSDFIGGSPPPPPPTTKPPPPPPTTSKAPPPPPSTSKPRPPPTTSKPTTSKSTTTKDKSTTPKTSKPTSPASSRSVTTNSTSMLPSNSTALPSSGTAPILSSSTPSSNMSYTFVGPGSTAPGPSSPSEVVTQQSASPSESPAPVGSSAGPSEPAVAEAAPASPSTVTVTATEIRTQTITINACGNGVSAESAAPIATVTACDVCPPQVVTDSAQPITSLATGTTRLPGATTAVACTTAFVCPYSQFACTECVQVYAVTVYVESSVVSTYSTATTVSASPTDVVTTSMVMVSPVPIYSNSTVPTSFVTRPSGFNSSLASKPTATNSSAGSSAAPTGSLTATSTKPTDTDTTTSKPDSTKPPTKAPTTTKKPTPTRRPPPTTTKKSPPPTPTTKPGNGGGKVNAAGVSLIESLEGFRPDYYYIDGDKTIGYGHDCTQKQDCANIHAPLSQAEGEALLRKDLGGYEACVCQLPHAGALSANQFSALVSFTYNSGCGGVQRFFGSYMARSDFAGICRALPDTNTLGGELSSRRAREGALCSQATSELSGC